MKEDRPFIPKDVIEFQRSQISLLTPINPSKIRSVLSNLDKQYEYKSKDYMSCIIVYFCGNISIKIALEQLSRLKTPPQLCGKIISKADFMWTCLDCSLKGNSTCYCHECFDIEKHKNHKYIYQVGTAGCCDCGDEVSLKPESFCEKHKFSYKENPSMGLLPPYNQIYGPIICEHLMKRLHKMLCEIPHDQLINPVKDTILSMQNVFMLLSNIFRLSPLFIDIIANCMLLKFNDHETTHVCEYKENKGENEGKLHICTCSVLDNIIKYVLHLTENKIISEFLSQLAKLHKEFGQAFLSSFWKNYPYIAKLSNKRQMSADFLEKILWQVISICPTLENCVLPYFNSILYVFDNLASQIIITPGNFDEAKFKAAECLLFDYRYFFNREGSLSQYLITQTVFVEKIIRILSRLQYVNHVIPIKEHIPYELLGINLNIYKAIHQFIEIVCYTFRHYDYKNTEINAYIFKVLFEEIKNDYKIIINKSFINTANTPLFMGFMIILAGYIHKTKITRIIDILPNLCELTNTPKVEILLIFDYISQRQIKVFQFLAKIDAGYWVHYGDAINLLKIFEEESRHDLTYLNICLLQICLAIFGLNNDNHKEKSIFAILGINELLKEVVLYDNDKNKLKRLLEKIVSLILQILFNDIAILSTILKCSYDFQGKMPNENINLFIENFYRKEISMLFIKEDEKERIYESVNFDLFIENIPYYLRVQNYENYFIDLFTRKEYPNEKICYKPNSQILNYMNLFNLASEKGKGLVNIELNIKGLKKVLNQQKINLFKTNFMIVPIQFIENINKILIENYLLNENISKETQEFILKIIKKDTEIYNNEMLQFINLKFIYEILLLDTKQIQAFFNTDFIIQIYTSINKFIENIKPENSYFDTFSELQNLLLNKHNSLLKIFPEISYQNNSQKSLPENSESSIKTKNRERQLQILAQYKAQQDKFKSKNIPEISSSTSIFSDQNLEKCCICTAPMQKCEFSRNPYGYFCFLTTSGIYHRAYFDTGKQITSQYEKISIPGIKPHILPERCKIFHSCGHMMHLSCFESYTKTRESKIYQCPACKNPMNSILPSIENQTLIKDIKIMKNVYEFFEPFRNDVMEETMSLSIIVIHFMDLLNTAISLVDLTNIHEIFVTKQKYFKCCLNSILSIISQDNFSEVSRYFEDTNRVNMRNLPMQNQTQVVTSRIFYNIFTHWAKSGKMQDDLEIMLKNNFLNGICIFLIQSAVKYYLLIYKNNELNKDEIANLGNEIAKIFTEKKEEIEKEFLHFLKKLIFIKSIIENWDYNDSSLENIRNILNKNNKSDSEKIQELLDILNISENPFIYLIEKLNNNENIFCYTKSAKLENILKKLGPRVDKKITPDISFYLTTTKLDFRFVTLPGSYSDLFLKFYPQICQQCKKSDQNKCLCLTCGAIVCANSACCRFFINKESRPVESIGEVTNHTLLCCGGTGIFLYLYYGTLILQSDKLGVQISSFYINKYGKDISFFCKNNGLPFTSTEFSKYLLNETKYKELREIIATGKEKYVIWQEINKGSGIVRSNV